MNEKTHYRKAFKSPYLSSADIVGDTLLTVARVQLKGDETKRTKDMFNTAHFAEKEIRQGEKLKPMILNATNSKMMNQITGSPFIEDWINVPVCIYVNHNVKNRGETVDGLRIKPAPQRPLITPQNKNLWDHAKAAFKRDGDLQAVLKKADMSVENQDFLMKEVESESV